MATCFARTDSTGRPYGLQSAAAESSTLPPIGTREKEYKCDLTFEYFKLYELLKLSKAEDLELLVNYLYRKDFESNTLVGYCRERATHYIRRNNIVYSCRRRTITETKQ